MSSQFFGLNIAYSGLLASNANLNTTANNIANVQTEGYSRQAVDTQAAFPIRTFQTYGCAGAGVDTLSVERIRDGFYDQKYWNNNSKLGEYNMKQYYMRELEDYFYDSGTNGGFSQIYDKLMTTALQEIMKDPGSSSAKSQFVGYAGQLTDYFNQIVGNLQNVQKDVNSEIKIKIDDINSISTEIATLNEQITTIEMGGQKANELRDRRDLLVDRLSEIVDVETEELPVYDKNDPERETGAYRYIVKIAGGQSLVDAKEHNDLTCVAREDFEKVNMTDINGLYDVYWENGEKFKLSNARLGGELRGLVELRDGNNGEYFSGTVIDTQVNGYNDPETGDHDTVTVQVTNDYLTDLNTCNLSDQGGIINLGNTEFYYDSWSYSVDIDASGNATYTYKFVLSNKQQLNPRHVTNDRVGKPAKIGENIKYEGIPYYMNQLNEWVRTFAEKFNDILKQGNQTDAHPEGTGMIMFTGNMPVDDQQYFFPNQTGTWRADTLLRAYTSKEDTVKQSTYGTSITVDVTDDSYYKLTAENFSILTAMVNDPTLMTNKFKAGDGVEQNDLLEALKDMTSEKDINSFRGSTASGFLEGVLSDVALGAAAANTGVASYESVQQAIGNVRLSVSGVDEDEEAVNLVKFQNAFNLSSKMISVFQEIYKRLILETGV
ncbi:MAG: flagellar hook-associated protein FlgK [Lachnospiraceae bacterium]|nr:flagellar hook-associated protein FlgK [Lachnospiraceae bacterium]